MKFDFTFNMTLFGIPAIWHAGHSEYACGIGEKNYYVNLNYLCL